MSKSLQNQSKGNFPGKKEKKNMEKIYNLEYQSKTNLMGITEKRKLK